MHVRLLDGLNNETTVIDMKSANISITKPNKLTLSTLSKDILHLLIHYCDTESVFNMAFINKNWLYSVITSINKTPQEEPDPCIDHVLARIFGGILVGGWASDIVICVYNATRSAKEDDNYSSIKTTFENSFLSNSSCSNWFSQAFNNITCNITSIACQLPSICNYKNITNTCTSLIDSLVQSDCYRKIYDNITTITAIAAVIGTFTVFPMGFSLLCPRDKNKACLEFEQDESKREPAFYLKVDINSEKSVELSSIYVQQSFSLFAKTRTQKIFRQENRSDTPLNQLR